MQILPVAHVTALVSSQSVANRSPTVVRYFDNQRQKLPFPSARLTALFLARRAMRLGLPEVTAGTSRDARVALNRMRENRGFTHTL